MKLKLRRQNSPLIGMFGICLLTVAAFAYAMFQGGFVSWFLFYSIVPVLLYVLAVSSFPMGSLEVHREVNSEVFASGATMRVKVTVTKHSWFPLFFCVVNDRLPEPLKKNAHGESEDFRNGSRALFFPGLRNTVQYTYTVDPMPRGEFELTEIELKTGDIFGFMKKSRLVTVSQPLLVYPRYESIHSWEPFEQYEEGSRRSRHHFHYDITSVASVREYSPGDRLSWLDWKSTARMNKLLTKEFERPLNEDLIVCIDRHADHYKEDLLFERAVTAAASMVRFGLKRGSSVGLLSFGKEKTVFPMGSGKDQQWKAFYHLAKTEADGQGNYFPLLSQAFRRFSVRANVVYITPVVDYALIKLIDGLSQRKQKVDLVLVREGNEAAYTSSEDIDRLRRQGAGVYILDGHNLNEALKAGIRYATS
ncbi:MAG TPA: DUF58 domain-containing protein [Bacillales bacterium]|nr:DUF58 domain-containing protein [Bacillales bacterium]